MSPKDIVYWIHTIVWYQDSKPQEYLTYKDDKVYLKIESSQTYGGSTHYKVSLCDEDKTKVFFCAEYLKDIPKDDCLICPVYRKGNWTAYLKNLSDEINNRRSEREKLYFEPVDDSKLFEGLSGKDK